MPLTTIRIVLWENDGRLGTYNTDTTPTSAVYQAHEHPTSMGRNDKPNVGTNKLLGVPSARGQDRFVEFGPRKVLAFSLIGAAFENLLALLTISIFRLCRSETPLMSSRSEERGFFSYQVAWDTPRPQVKRIGPITLPTLY